MLDTQNESGYPVRNMDSFHENEFKLKPQTQFLAKTQ